MLESWEVGMLERWKVGRLESWNVGKLESREARKLENYVQKIGKLETGKVRSRKLAGGLPLLPLTPTWSRVWHL